MQVMLEFDKKPLSFTNPVNVISCNSAKELPARFQEIEAVLAKGFYVAGFASYEAGYAFEKKNIWKTKNMTFPCFVLASITSQKKEAVAASKVSR